MQIFSKLISPRLRFFSFRGEIRGGFSTTGVYIISGGDTDILVLAKGICLKDA